MIVSTKFATPPKSTTSRNSDSSVSRGTNSNRDFGWARGGGDFLAEEYQVINDKSHENPVTPGTKLKLKVSRNNFTILCHPICNRLYFDIEYSISNILETKPQYILRYRIFDIEDSRLSIVVLSGIFDMNTDGCDVEYI